MTCKDIFDLYASDTEKSDLYDAYRNVPLDSRDEMHKNNTPLHTACYFADITAVGILLERGVDTNARNDDGDTPLCVMAKRNSCPNDTLYADISGLLLYEGAKVTRSGKNTTALIEAVRNRHFLMADVLRETVLILPTGMVTMCCTLFATPQDTLQTILSPEKNG